MLITILILVAAAAFFVSGKFRSDIVALCALLGLLIFQILTPEEALAGFSNQVVIMMIGLFVVGGAIFQTGLAKMISSKILKLAGKSELRLFLLVMLVTGFMLAKQTLYQLSYGPVQLLVGRLCLTHHSYYNMVGVLRIELKTHPPKGRELPLHHTPL